MRLSKQIRLATWMLEHLHIGPYGESFAGDLEEELCAGRSTGWYWRQVLSAIGMDVLTLLHACAIPVVFSAGWSMLYPIWVVAERGGGMQAALERLTSYSTSLDLVSEVIPAIVFLWAGLFVYLIYVSVRSGGRVSLSMTRVAGGLSIGFHVLLVVTVALLHYDMPRMLNLRFARHEDFYASARVAAIHTPLALSLFASILCARPFMRSGFLRRLRAGDCEI
jgi:hypothetical protein